MLAKRGTSFGYGVRRLFPQKDITPSPGSYSTQSDFEKKGKGKTFGLARELPGSRHGDAAKFMNYSVPGPGSYNVANVTGKNACKYSLRPKTANLGNKCIEYRNTKNTGYTWSWSL